MKDPDKKSQFSLIEEDLIELWTKEKTFEQSLERRKDSKRFRFYDGPPFTSGPPHYGHVEQSALKDAIARYKTMRGYYVPRRTGADTHGLPVENLVEKEHGFKTKKDIAAFGIDKFNQACREVVFRHKSDFDDMYKRLGRWDNPEASYATLDDKYIESVWWVFSELHKKGLIYKGFKSMPYCPRCATPLSNFEVNDGYKDDVPDPSVYIKFQLTEESISKLGTTKKDHGLDAVQGSVEEQSEVYKSVQQTSTADADAAMRQESLRTRGSATRQASSAVSFLAWTTTPWTLPANAALAVDEKAEYAIVELRTDGDGWKKGERLILAKQKLGLLDLKKTEYRLVETKKGKELVGLKYVPLYAFAEFSAEEDKTVHRVYADESVSLDDGTGILHVAPRYGETDLNLGLKVGLPLIESVDGNGHMSESMGSFKGMFFKDADGHIIADLTKKGRVFASETFSHTYPFCWRCETPLLYFAMPSWFVAVTKFRDQLVEAGKSVNWVPSHVKPGRFIKWLEGARDWAISRNRFWGAPIPVWVNEEDENDIIVISSLEQLKKLSGTVSKVDMHRPGIDQLVIQKDGKTYRRVEEVLDCWFESGSMPYGQDHYPFEHKEDFEASFPAEFVCEAIEQVHLWFYTLHVLAVALFNKPAYQNVVATGLILGADGLKLSKRLRNYPPVKEVFTEFGADTLRFFFLESPLMNAGDTRLSHDALRDVQRNVFMTLWNTYKFFKMYSEVDKWRPGESEAFRSDNVLDNWILARLNQTIDAMTQHADKYHVNRALKPLREMIEDLSNWYVRRSRRRFWKSEDDSDKAAAYETLHFVLLRVCQLLAPWAPFLSDYIYRDLTQTMNGKESVHLSDWPEPEEPDHSLLLSMEWAREVVNEGLAQRAEAGIKLRQPLQKATLAHVKDKVESLVALEDIIREELNVKDVEWDVMVNKSVVVDTKLTEELKREGLVRDLVRHIQNARKTAGLSVDDRIILEIWSQDKEIVKASADHGDYLAAETLANEVNMVQSDLHSGDDFSQITISGHKLGLILKQVEK